MKKIISIMLMIVFSLSSVVVVLGEPKTTAQRDSAGIFNNLFVNTIYPYTQDYVAFKTDAIVQYSKDGSKKNTYGYDSNGGRITANGDLTLEPSKYVVAKTDAIVMYSKEGRKSTYGYNANGSRITADGDITLDPTRNVIIDGNVGIGTTNPGAYKLYVDGGVGIAVDTPVDGGILLNSDGGSPSIAFSSNHLGKWQIRSDKNDDHKLKFIGDNGVSVDEFVTFDQKGNVGIGTTEPKAKLDVVGNQRIQGFITPSIDNTYGLGDMDYRWYWIEVGNGGIRSKGDITTSGRLNIVNGVSSNSTIANNVFMGKVGIGTTEPTTKLQVEGDVRVGSQYTGGNRVLNIQSKDGQAELDISPAQGNDGFIQFYDGMFPKWSLYHQASTGTFSIWNLDNLKVVSISNQGKLTADSDIETKGVLRSIPKPSAVCDSNTEGGFYYDSDDKHFYGCDGNSWKQLD